MRILVLGAGSIGRRHIGNLAAIGLKNLVIADPNPKVLAMVKGAFDFVETTTDPAKAFENGKFDAAIICSPPQIHLRQLAEAVERGIHAFVEKPFTLNSDGVEAVLKKADSRKLCV